jgi:hypothetical protein
MTAIWSCQSQPVEEAKLIKYNREQARKCIMDDWLGHVLRFPDKLFKHTFHLKCHMVDTILNHLAKHTCSGGRLYAELASHQYLPM